MALIPSASVARYFPYFLWGFSRTASGALEVVWEVIRM